jgi:pilus assembly protein FimV
LPTGEQAQAVSTKEAAQIVIAQSKDFNDFRQNLASNAPVAAVATSDRKASGSVGAKVEDKKPASTTPDKLTLSKGSVQSKVNDAAIAKERADKESADRAAEIAKNIADLSKLNAAAKPAASKPVVPVPAVPLAATPSPVASVPVASAPAPKPSVPAPVAAPDTQEPGLLDGLLENPMVPLAVGGLLALLAGLGLYKVRQRKKGTAQVDSSFLESRLQPDSFFGASGGQRVDTSAASATTNSSMAYSPSQLDAADDVDPVAEADVYLAYGRDVQAEEILKEASRVTPTRLAIYLKLLEIYSKRRDTQSFEAAARQALKITGNEGADWSRVCAMGIAIDPANSLYQPGGTSSATAPGTDGAQADPEFSESKAVDLDLDLDFSTDETPVAQMDPHPSDNGTMLDFDVSDPIPLSVEPEMGLDFEPTNNLPPELAMPTSPAALTESIPAAEKDTGMLEFDLASLSLDLDPPVEKAAEAATEEPANDVSADDEPASTMSEDPLETKLALAEEFVSIGDEDGARALIEEVISEATGEVRTKAQKALAALS